MFVYHAALALPQVPLRLERENHISLIALVIGNALPSPLKSQLITGLRSIKLPLLRITITFVKITDIPLGPSIALSLLTRWKGYR